MKLNRKIFWISLIVSIITLIISIILEFWIDANDTAEFCKNIFENIFAGTIVLVVTSVYQYNSDKKEILEALMIETLNIEKMFKKLKYFDNRDFIIFNRYRDYYKGKIDDQSKIKTMYDKSKSKYLNKQKQSFNSIIDQYIEIADKDFNEFWLKYSKIAFLLDFNNKKRHKIYYDFFHYIYYDKVQKIREKVYHFKEYKNSEFGNYSVNKEFLSELQKEIFYFEERDTLKNCSNVEFNISENEVDICAYGEDGIRGTYYLIGNKVTKNIKNFYKYINSITYSRNVEEKMNIRYKTEKIDVKSYNKLTDSVGWGIRKESIIKEGLKNTLYSICAYDNNRLIGYGRIIGDKTIFLYIHDVMVIPEYQGKQIGTGIMKKLLKQIDEYKKVNPNIRTYLGASNGKKEFYEKFGFISRPNEDLGAGMILYNK